MNKFLFTLVTLLCFGCTNYGQLEVITKLPKSLKENSGIVSYSASTAWFIEDNGNNDNIYKTDFEGNIIQQFDVKNVKNTDWEDLSKDVNGNLYIGDIGNNDRERTNLSILKLPNPEKEKGDKIDAETINFSYPTKGKIPDKDELTYDAEAFFHYDGSLFVFTKNSSTPFTGETKIYSVPDKKGSYEAELIGSINLCNDWDTCRITSAAISNDGETIVLLSHGKLWIIKNFTMESLSEGSIQEIDLGVRTQLESVCFLDDTTLLISDEERKNTGRNLYSFKLR